MLHVDLRRAGFAVPLRIGAAMAVVFLVGGLTGHRDLAGFAALGALISAFCRPDPYPVRWGRLTLLGVAMTMTVGIGAALGAFTKSALIAIVAVSLLAGAAAYLLSALHIVGPGAVIFMFAAVGAEGFATDLTDVWRVSSATAAGAVVGIGASLLPWLWQRGAGRDGVQREPLWTTLRRAPHRALLAKSVRIAFAGSLGAGIAAALGLAHPMWAAMGAVASMQGLGYHVTVHRGIQRLVGNIAGGLLAAVLLALPLGYWGAVAAVLVFQTLAEVFSTVNYALTSAAVTPMALLLTALSAGLEPGAAVDRVLDTLVGIVVGIVTAAVTISGADAENLTAHRARATQRATPGRAGR